MKHANRGKANVVCNQGGGGGSRQGAWTLTMQLDQMNDMQPCSCTSLIDMEDVLPGHGRLFVLGGRWRSVLIKQHTYEGERHLVGGSKKAAIVWPLSNL
jgi:hypothetical protein